jgi:hypothetical protein
MGSSVCFDVQICPHHNVGTPLILCQPPKSLTLPTISAVGIARRVAPWETEGGGARRTWQPLQPTSPAEPVGAYPSLATIAAQIRRSSRWSAEHEDLLLTPEESVRRSVNLLWTGMV